MFMPSVIMLSDIMLNVVAPIPAMPVDIDKHTSLPQYGIKYYFISEASKSHCRSANYITKFLSYCETPKNMSQFLKKWIKKILQQS